MTAQAQSRSPIRNHRIGKGIVKITLSATALILATACTMQMLFVLTMAARETPEMPTSRFALTALGTSAFFIAAGTLAALHLRPKPQAQWLKMATLSLGALTSALALWLATTGPSLAFPMPTLALGLCLLALANHA